MARQQQLFPCDGCAQGDPSLFPSVRGLPVSYCEMTGNSPAGALWPSADSSILREYMRHPGVSAAGIHAVLTNVLCTMIISSALHAHGLYMCTTCGQLQILQIALQVCETYRHAMVGTSQQPWHIVGTVLWTLPCHSSCDQI